MTDELVPGSPVSAQPAPFVVSPTEAPSAQAEALLSRAVVAEAGVLLVDIVGPGAVACIQGLMTGDLEAPGDGAFVYGATLTPKGMIVSDLWAGRTGTTVTLTYPASARETLFDMFKRQLPPRLARVTDRAGAQVVLRMAGPAAVATAERAGLSVPAPGRVARSPFRPADCVISRPTGDLPFALEIHVAPENSAGMMSALNVAGAVTVSGAALELGRILAGWPRLGAEIDEKTLPQEVRFDEIGGVSYTKGCYTGQETVARLHFRGHTNRVLIGLAWQDAPDVHQGAVVQADRSVGRVTSLAWCGAIEQYVGLALVRRDTDRDQPVRAGEAPARIVDLPFKLTA
ncbi:MAG: hypothetical protein EXR93_06885 [Gemmatimonadetes bacterium]|nr:hypothetical protein [Gemmatimonadota bacterium]